MREALTVPANDPSHKFYDVTTLQIGRGPGVHGFNADTTVSASRPAPSEASDVNVSDMANAFNLKLKRNPATVSKAIDPQTGEPLVVYHGTAADVEFFDPLALGANTHAQSAKGGFFFAASPKVASGYAAEHCERLFDGT